MICLAPLVLGRISLWRLVRSASPLEGDSWRILLRQSAERVGLTPKTWEKLVREIRQGIKAIENLYEEG